MPPARRVVNFGLGDSRVDSQKLPDLARRGLLWLFFLWFPRPCAALLPILLAVLSAGTAEAGAGHVAPVCPLRSDTSGALWAVADFDGDNVVDLARIEVSRQGDDVTTSGIELFSLCSTSLPPMLGAFPRTGLVFSARDVDVDNDLDLVLREQFAGRALALWLNDWRRRPGAFIHGPPRLPLSPILPFRMTPASFCSRRFSGGGIPKAQPEPFPSRQTHAEAVRRPFLVSDISSPSRSRF